MQLESKPVLIGILFYLNELSLFQEDLKELKNDVKNGKTDIKPNANDLKKILKWKTNFKPPKLSDSLKNLRSIRIIPIEYDNQENSLNEFDSVVENIERSILCEVNGNGIQSSWDPNPEKRTCDACDFNTFCKESKSTKKFPTVP